MENVKKLTERAYCAGCAAKLRAEILMDVINPFGKMFSQGKFPDLLIGLEEADDAAVYRLSDEQALVFTTDFFPPPVDNPYDYGAIAAANSISDIYAMGAKPLMALNIAAIPTDLPAETAAEIFRGGAEKAIEAGIPIVGGHTVRDPEPKYGLAVIGLAHPNRILRKSTLEVGDQLILTKPLGFGLLTTANKAGLADESDFAEVVAWMKALNKTASELALQFGSVCATDVTGFSLLGHSLEMARSPGIGIHYHYSQIPYVSHHRHYMDMGLFPAGAAENALYYETQVDFDPSINELEQMMLFDPQTSGGLLIALKNDQVQPFLAAATQKGQFAVRIGEAIHGDGILVTN